MTEQNGGAAASTTATRATATLSHRIARSGAGRDRAAGTGPPSPPGRRGAGELEEAILGVLRNSGSALTPTQLVQAVSGDLAYNTVHTVLTRLVAKGAVVRIRDRGRTLYTARQGTTDAAAARMAAVLSTSDDHVVTLRRFVLSLTSEDEQILRALLRREHDAFSVLVDLRPRRAG